MNHSSWLRPVVPFLLGFPLAAATILLPPIEIPEDTALLRHPIPLAGTGATNPLVVLDRTSAAGSLFPEGAVVLGTTDGAWHLTAVPAPNASGNTELGLLLLEGNPPIEVGRIRFPIHVLPVNDAPRISPIPDRRWFVHGSFVPVPLQIDDPDDAATFQQPEVLENTIGSSLIPVIRRTGTNTFSLAVEGLNQFIRPGILRIRLAATDRAGAQDSHVFQAVVEPPWVNIRTNRGPSLARVPFTLVDLDRNGIPDIHRSGSQFSSPAFLLWDTQSNSYPATGTGGAVSPETVMPGVWTDFNRDGHPDFLQPRPPNTLQLWAQSSNSARVAFDSIPFTNVPCTAQTRLAAGDLDGDGDPDIVLSTPGTAPTSRTRILLSTGNGNLEERVPSLLGIGGAVTLGDTDNDGDLDLLVLNRPNAAATPGTPLLLLNDGLGRFSSDVLATDPGNVVSCGLVDYDLDGRLDLWLLRIASPQRIAVELRLYRGTATGFVAGPAFEGPHSVLDEFRGEPPAPVFADFDQDGLLDVLCAGRHEGVAAWYFHRQHAPGFFTPVARLPQAPSNPSALAAVLDTPGRLDLLVPQATGIQTFSNTLAFPNLPPSAPTRPRATLLRPGLVRLSWDPSIDLNQPSGLTYNVRAGRRPGTDDIVPALALPSGRRLVQGDGNAGRRTDLLLDLAGVELGDLHWSVQAIDANGTGGAFTPASIIPALGEQSPPVVPDLPEFNFEEDGSATIELAISDGPMPASALRATARVLDRSLANVSLTRISSGEDQVRLRIQVFSTPDSVGTTELELTVTDPAGLSSTRKARVNVTPVNDAPRIAEATDLPIRQFTGEIPAPLRLQFLDVDSPIASCTVHVSVDPPSAWPNAQRQVTVADDGRIQIRRLDPAPDVPMTVTVTVSDPTATSEPRLLRIQPLRRWMSDPQPITTEPNRHPAFADLEGDGDLDLAWLDNNGNLRLLENLGADGWASQSTDLGGGHASFRWGDINGDGRPDIAAEGAAGSTFTTLLNRTNGWFANQRNTGTGFVVSQWGDLDNDGRPDFIGFEDTTNNTAALVLLTPSTRTTLLRTRGGAQSIHPGDWDADGSPDVLVFRPDHGWSWIHRPRPNAAWQDLPLPWAAELGEVAWLDDFDRDGRLDAFVGVLQWTRVPLPRSAAHRQFLPGSNRIHGILDLDGQGPGWLTWPGSDTLHWSRPAAFGPPVEPTPLTLQHAAADPVIADVDGNGVPDIAVLLIDNSPDNTTASLQLIRGNRAPAPVPDPPTPDAPRFFDSLTRLAWTPPSNATNARLRYRVRVGTAPGLADIVNPDADPSGRRLVPIPPATGLATAHDIHGLVPGRDYYWSVQAISPEGRGGPFTEPRSFRPPADALAFTGPAIVQVAAEDRELRLELGPGLPAGVVLETQAEPGLILDSLVPETDVTDGRITRLRYPLAPRRSGMTDLRITAIEPSGRAARLDTTVLRPSATNGVHVLSRVTAYLGADGSARFDTGLPGITGLAGHPVFDGDFPGTLETTEGGFRWTPIGPLNGAVPTLGFDYTDSSNRRFLAVVRVLDQAGPLALQDAGPDGWRLRIADSPFLGGSVESSTDLQHWTPANDYRVSGTGHLDIPVSVGVGDTRFFRIVPR